MNVNKVINYKHNLDYALYWKNLEYNKEVDNFNKLKNLIFEYRDLLTKEEKEKFDSFFKLNCEFKTIKLS